jgi:hypothetical protein
MSSLGSAVLAGLLDVCELSDMELSEGDRKLALRRCWGLGCGETAGDRFRPLPNTRPPPRDLREAMSRVSRMFSGGQGHGGDMQPRRVMRAGYAGAVAER